MGKKRSVILLSLVIVCIIGGFLLSKKMNENKVRLIENTYQFSTINFHNTTFDIVKIEPEHINRIHFYYKDKNETGFGNIVNLGKGLSARDEKLIFAINGGIFSQTYTPLGLYVENGKEVSKINTSDGEGNFFLKPNGIFSIQNNKGKVIETSAYQYSPTITFALQSGPLLVLNNEINPLFAKDSQNKYIRNGVGIAQDGSIIFAISNEPVTFYEFASFFKENLGSYNALYLDGAISEMYVPKYREKTKENLSVIIGIVIDKNYNY